MKFEAYPGIADGTIIRQYPLRGAPVSSRDPISVVVSRQEETSDRRRRRPLPATHARRRGEVSARLPGGEQELKRTPTI